MVWVTWKPKGDKEKGKVDLKIHSFVQGRMFPKTDNMVVPLVSVGSYDGRTLTYHQTRNTTTNIYIGNKYSDEVQRKFKGMVKDSKSERHRLIDKYANNKNVGISDEIKKKRFKRLKQKAHQLYRERKIQRFKINDKTGEIEVTFPRSNENVPLRYTFGLNYIFVYTKKNEKLQEQLLTEFGTRGKSVWQIEKYMMQYQLGINFNRLLSAYDLRRK